MRELLEITLRPTPALLREAAGLVWPSQAALEQKAFCNHVHEVVKTLFTKSRNMTTGERQPDSVSRMCTHVKGLVSKNNDTFSSPGKESAAAEVAPACKAVVKRKASKLEPTLPVHSTRKLQKVTSLRSDGGNSELNFPKLQLARTSAASMLWQDLPATFPAAEDVPGVEGDGVSASTSCRIVVAIQKLHSSCRRVTSLTSNLNKTSRSPPDFVSWRRTTMNRSHSAKSSGLTSGRASSHRRYASMFRELRSRTARSRLCVQRRALLDDSLPDVLPLPKVQFQKLALPSPAVWELPPHWSTTWIATLHPHRLERCACINGEYSLSASAGSGVADASSCRQDKCRFKTCSTSIATSFLSILALAKIPCLQHKWFCRNFHRCGCADHRHRRSRCLFRVQMQQLVPAALAIKADCSVQFWFRGLGRCPQLCFGWLVVHFKPI